MSVVSDCETPAITNLIINNYVIWELAGTDAGRELALKTWSCWKATVLEFGRQVPRIKLCASEEFQQISGMSDLYAAFLLL